MSFSLLHVGSTAVRSNPFTDIKSVRMVPSEDPGGVSFYEAQDLATFNYDETQARSAFVWLKPNDLSRAYGLFGNAAPGSGGGFEAFYSASLSKIRFNWTGSLGTVTLDTDDQVLEVDKWVLFGWTYDGTDTLAGLKLYANGQELSRTNPGGSFPAGDTENLTHAFRVGGFAQGRTPITTFNGFDGEVGDCYLFDDELTAAEVEELYYRGVGAVPEELSTGLNSKFVHHYMMGDNSSDTDNIIKDRLGNGNLQGVGADLSIAQDPEIVDEYPFVLQYGIEFDAATPNYIETSNVNAGQFSGFNSKTFLFWVKVQTDNVVLLNKRGPIASNGWAFTYFSGFGGLNLQVIGTPGGGGTDEMRVSFGTVPNINDWVCIAVTCDGTGVGAGVSGYFNGVGVSETIATNTLTNIDPQNITGLRVGADRLSGPTSPSDAIFSQIAILDGVLSLANIQEFYNAGIGADVRQMSWYNSANLDVYLIPGQDVNDDVGSTVRDYSPSEWVFDKVGGPTIVNDPVSPIT